MDRTKGSIDAQKFTRTYIEQRSFELLAVLVEIKERHKKEWQAFLEVYPEPERWELYGTTGKRRQTDAYSKWIERFRAIESPQNEELYSHPAMIELRELQRMCYRITGHILGGWGVAEGQSCCSCVICCYTIKRH